jgi:hypothetical protein
MSCLGFCSNNAPVISTPCYRDGPYTVLEGLCGERVRVRTRGLILDDTVQAFLPLNHTNSKSKNIHVDCDVQSILGLVKPCLKRAASGRQWVEEDWALDVRYPIYVPKVLIIWSLATFSSLAWDAVTLPMSLTKIKRKCKSELAWNELLYIYEGYFLMSFDNCWHSQ